MLPCVRVEQLVLPYNSIDRRMKIIYMKSVMKMNIKGLQDCEV